MRVVLTDVIKRPALDTTTLAFGTGEAVLARAETEQRPTVLGLLASGRMRPDSGTVTIDGAENPRALRRAVALLDAPEVSDPAPNVTVAGVTAEELMFAGRPSSRRAVMRMLDELGLDDHAGEAIGQLAPHLRIRLLVELALLRTGVQGIVLTAPDRHGGDPSAWWHIALETAARGYAVLVIAGDASAAAIAAASLVERLEIADAPAPAGDTDETPVNADDADETSRDADDASSEPDNVSPDHTDPVAGHESSES